MHCIEPKALRGAAAIALVALLAACATPSSPAPPPRTVAPRPGPVPALPAPQPARNWDDYRHQAALRIVAANPNGSYMTTPPDPLLAIPVLVVDLDADGRIRNITVRRYPKQARDTVQLAIDAVKRAAPFGSVANLPRPWRFVEVFLFDDERRFKPRSLDED